MAPEVVPLEEVPPSHAERLSKWAEVIAHTQALVNNAEVRETHAVRFGPTDGIDEKNQSKAAQAIRTAAGRLGWRMSVIWDQHNGMLYGKCIGPREHIEEPA